MTNRQKLGVLFAISPIIGLFVFIMNDMGWYYTFQFLGLVVGVCIWIIVSLWLLDIDPEE